MEKRKLRLTMLIAVICFHHHAARAQQPVNDPAWILQSSLSDDFSGTSINSSKWTVPNGVPDHGRELMYSNNVTVSGGQVSMRVDTLDPNVLYGGTTYQYQSGTFWSNSPSYKYGYLEISAKFPVGHRAYWPAFWVWMSDCSGNSQWYEEIDQTEIGPDESEDMHSYQMNTYLSNPSTPDTCEQDPLMFTQQTIGGLPQLNAAYHKYAMQWDPDHITYYFDDVKVAEVSSAEHAIPQHGLELRFDIYVNPWDDVTTWPHMPTAYMDMDYFHYYKLNTDCSSNLTISDPATHYYSATPARAVKKSITCITVGGSSPTFNLSDQCTLRATDYVLLDAGTTVNGTGSGQFSAVITPCPE